MKILSLLALVSFGAFASSEISNYQGHTYKKAEYDLCLNDYDMITKNVDSAAGYTVLSGGCLEDGSGNFKMQFDYIHPLASEIKNFSVPLSNEAACLSSIKKAQAEILSSGNYPVATYCEGKELNTQFIDTTHSIVRSLNKLGKFNSFMECSNFLSELTNKAKASKMISLMSSCQEIKYDYTGTVYFNATFNYISYFEIELGLINGKSVASQSACAEGRLKVEQNFASSDIKIVHAYCTGAMTSEQSTQESILYLIPKNGRYITSYEGLTLNSSEDCETQLNSITSGLEHAGNKVLYGFCKDMGGKKFRPSITYVKTIEL